MHRSECSHGHPQRGPMDYFPDGQCRHCDRDRQAKYKTRRKEAMGLLRSLESRGIDITDIQNRAEKVSVALQILDICDVDPIKAERIMQRNPDLFLRAMQTVDKLAKVARTK